MSQVASAFGLPTKVLTKADRELANNELKKFWETVRPCRICEGFPWDGYVVVVVVEFLQEKEIELPVSSEAQARNLVLRMNPLVCASPEEAAEALATLNALQTTDEELTTFWRNFTGDKDNAAKAMRAALEWLKQVFAEGQKSDWCIILEG
jgi:hypothetical protein